MIFFDQSVRTYIMAGSGMPPTPGVTIVTVLETLAPRALAPTPAEYAANLKRLRELIREARARAK